MQYPNDKSHSSFTHTLRKASSSYLTSESSTSHLQRLRNKNNHRQSASTSGGSDQMEIEKENYFDLNSAKLIYSDKLNQWASASTMSTTSATTPTKASSSTSSSRRLFLQQKTSNSSASASSSSSSYSCSTDSPPMLNRTPLKSLTNFPLNVKEKTKAFTKSMTEVVSKSSHSFFANLHMTPKLTECTSTYDYDDADEDEDIPTDCDSGNYNDKKGTHEEHENDEDEIDSEDEGDATFDTINIESPIMHRKTNSIQINQQQEENYNHETLLQLPTRSTHTRGPPITTRPKTIRRIHSVCETQREIDNFQLHEDNSQLKHTNIHTFTLGNDVLPRINEDQLYKILCGEHKHEFDEYIIVDCRFDYEYHGGHIINAMNISSKEALENAFIKQIHESHQQGSSPATNNNNNHNSNKSKKKLLIFHCEFSIFRGPTMAKHLRKCDRMMNQNSYPFLSWPDVVILEGGYKRFFTKYKSFCFPQNYVEMKDIKHEVSCEANLSRVRKDNKLLTRAKSFNQFGGGNSGGIGSGGNGDHLPNRPSALTSASTNDFWSMSSHSRSLSSSSSTTLNSGKVIKRQRSHSKVKSISTNLNTKLTRANTFTFDQPIFTNNLHQLSSSSSSIASTSSPLTSPLFSNFDFSEEVEKENPLHLQQQQQQHIHTQHHPQQQQQQHQLRSFLPPSTSFRNSHHHNQQQLHHQHHKAQLSLSLLLLLLYRHRRSFSSNMSNYSSFSNYSSSSISIHSSASSIVSENISLSTDSLNDDAYVGSDMFSRPPGTSVAGSAAGADIFDAKRLSSTSTPTLPTVASSMMKPVSRKPSSLQTSLAALAPTSVIQRNDTIIASSPASHANSHSHSPTHSRSPSRSPFLQPSSSFQFPPRQKKSMSTSNVIGTTLASPTIPSPLNSTTAVGTAMRASSRSRSRSRSRARENSIGSFTSSSTPFSSLIDDYVEEDDDDVNDNDNDNDPINASPVDFNVGAPLQHQYAATSRGRTQYPYNKKHHYHQLATKSGLNTWSNGGGGSGPGSGDHHHHHHHGRSHSIGHSSNDTIVLDGMNNEVVGGGGGYGYANVSSVDDITEDDEEDL